jgi:hypothetical protein
VGILNIRKAVRTGSKVVIGIAGISGSGKTYTAIKLARGMVDHAGEIGFLDSENRRGSLNADILDGQFLIGDLYPPFSPKRYADAIKEFQSAGVKVLVVDSASHVWEGEGGCEDIANAPLLAGKLMADWKKAKAEHKKFMSALLQSDMHVIVCLRAREKMDFSNPKKPASLGTQPVCEKNFIFEMTASMMMWDEGRTQQFLKMPEALRAAFGNGQGYLDESHGRALIDWVNSGDRVDLDLESWKNKLQLECASGSEALKALWLSMPEDTQSKMMHMKSQFWSSATSYDAINGDDTDHSGALEKLISMLSDKDPGQYMRWIGQQTGTNVTDLNQLTSKQAAFIVSKMENAKQ